MAFKKQLTLISGGARSGKSSFAQDLASRSTLPVVFLATAQAHDDEMRRRIAAHRQARPAHWRTVEEPLRVAQVIGQEAAQHQLIVLDCLALLVSNLLLREGEEPSEAAEANALAEIEGLLAAYQTGQASLIIVTNEVGLGLVPPYPLGRAYRDLLGKANQLIAKVADKVYFMVCGLPLEIKASGLARPFQER